MIHHDPTPNRRSSQEFDILSQGLILAACIFIANSISLDYIKNHLNIST
jgi:hypothetical protein